MPWATSCIRLAQLVHTGEVPREASRGRCSLLRQQDRHQGAGPQGMHLLRLHQCEPLQGGSEGIDVPFRSIERLKYM